MSLIPLLEKIEPVSIYDPISVAVMVKAAVIVMLFDEEQCTRDSNDQSLGHLHRRAGHHRGHDAV